MLEIRQEQNSDRDKIFQIHQNAFQRDDEAQLVEKLRLNKQFDIKYSFVAIIDKTIVGHILFTPLKIIYPSISKTKSSLALAPISILSQYQRQGIGSQLIKYAIDKIKNEQDISSIIVLGHEHYYPKFGFKPARLYNIRAPIALKNENCFMVLELKPELLEENKTEGIVQYLPEFGI